MDSHHGATDKLILNTFNVIHFPCNFIIYITFNTSLLHNYFFVNYCANMFRRYLLAIFRELTSF